MSDLEDLIYTLRTRNTDVVHARNEGNGAVPVHYVDDLTDAVAALLAYVDEAEAEKEERARTCVACGAVGEVQPTGSEPNRLVLCVDAYACRDRLRAGRRQGEHDDLVARVGDLIGEAAAGIPANVVELVDCEGDTWRRPRCDAEAMLDGQRYDWVTEGGWSTTVGRMIYAPLRVTKVWTHG